ncbi:hypothetical protein NS365_18945 [Aureimonas ureilytica]|uniref:Uncharacterized protein n=1 Tax=Aureimonas ureilytica TaxID=401562 RepID=A0A175R8S6_9HYPH|nr:hypothetical protein NS226_11235 [Aureimonas ureilytica]KTR03258.1 hypothetical protein NS365_18945 [Aureimonas ureilytica]
MQQLLRRVDKEVFFPEYDWSVSKVECRTEMFSAMRDSSNWNNWVILYRVFQFGTANDQQ